MYVNDVEFGVKMEKDIKAYINGIKKIISEKQYFYMTFKPRKHSFKVKIPLFILCDKFENAFFDKLLLDDYYFINEKDEKLFSYEAYKTEDNCLVPKVLKDEERSLVFSCKYDKNGKIEELYEPGIRRSKFEFKYDENGDLCSYILHELFTQNDTLHSYLYEIEYKETKDSFLSVHTKYFADNKQYIGKTVYETDKISGKRKETRYINSDQEYFSVLDYDEKFAYCKSESRKISNEIEEKNIGEENAIVDVTDTEYDINGDWIYKIVKKTILTKDGKTKEFLNIKYYSDGREEVLEDFKLKA